ncbi:hypothetical protein [Microvirga sp. Mcv34]|uniref:hypothetical protein n=1 Tax=Microvirga sp. Mcv34 TaxID=2926016 RepID=UPI0021C56B21|nr:hypothetical protein [Microvirga sp. Mcv34]
MTMKPLTSYGAPDPELMGPRPRKPLPAHCHWFREFPCRNGFQMEQRGGLYDDGHVYRYRVTPPGERKVPEILTPGTLVRMSWCECSYVVLSTTGPFWFHDPDSSRVFEKWSLQLVSPDEWETGRKEPTAWVNDLVAVGSRVRALFENNDDEIVVEGKHAAVRKPAPKAVTRPVQLEMFA